MGDDWPEPDAAAALYQRLAAGTDPVAPSDFAAAFLDPLVAFLRGTRRGTDDHAIQTAAEEAVLSVIRRPAVYDPTRGTIVAFLRMAAAADLNNLRTKEARHHRNREDRECVELPGATGNTPTSDDLPSFDHPALAEVLASLDATEQRVFELMRTGERATEAYAAILGITDRPVGEQAAEVKRVKERIMKRLQRAAGAL
jgi:DNA-directed RNA polymerase specialized sigma24 family protein